MDAPAGSTMARVELDPTRRAGLLTHAAVLATYAHQNQTDPVTRGKFVRLAVDLTPREREIAALLIEGLTSKLIGKKLEISPRTVDVYRARLMKKHRAATTPELVQKLLRA